MPLFAEQTEHKTLFCAGISPCHTTWTKPTDKCRAVQFQTSLPHLGSSSEKTNSRLNLNPDFQEVEFILASLWNLRPWRNAVPSFRVQWAAIPSREQATEISFSAEHPAPTHTAWDLGWIPSDFDRRVSLLRLWDRNRTTAAVFVNMLLSQHCSYEPSVLCSGPRTRTRREHADNQAPRRAQR